MEMKKNVHKYLMPALLLCLLSCSHKGIDGVDDSAARELVPVEFAFSLEGAESATKANTSILTELDNTEDDVNHFRGIENIRVLAFSADTEETEVTEGMLTISPIRPLPPIAGIWDRTAVSGNAYHTGLVRNIRAHLYANDAAAFPEGTSHVVLYGNAGRVARGTVQEEKHLNGSLIEDGLDAEDAPSGHYRTSGVSFSPDPIYTGVVSPQATQIAQLLTGIASAVTYTPTYIYYINEEWVEGHNSITWNENVSETSLRQYFRWFTGDGELMTGAGVSVEYMLSNLYGRLLRFNSDDDEQYQHIVGGVAYPTYTEDEEHNRVPFTYGHLYNGLRQEILRHFTDLENYHQLDLDPENYKVTIPEELRNYPVSLGLPAGAAVLRWNGIKYVVVTEGLDGIAAMDHYCYMPPLYYYVNTPVSASQEKDLSALYTESTGSWAQVLNAYRDGRTVRATTHSLALDRPIVYATGMLVATVQASASLLPDNDDDSRTNCSVTGTNFPVTGILLGSQYKQRFNFTPYEDETEYFLYDNQLGDVYLTTAKSHDFRTLVLPTPQDEDVLFFLEFRNDSGATFTGAEGLVLPGNYFYLAGKLEKPTAEDIENNLDRVFMSDHYTQVNCVVSSFENAHVAVPEVGNSQLVVGVQTSMNWVMSASSYVVLD